MSSHQDQPRSDRPATQVMLLLAAGRTKEAERLLMDSYLGQFKRMFANNSLHHLSEEMISETFYRFLTLPDPLQVADHAEPTLRRIARNVLIDFARKANTLSRGGGKEDGPAEVLLDDEALLDALAADAGLYHDPVWYQTLVDCVHRAMAFFRKEKARLAETLWLEFLEYTTVEVAIYYGADPNGPSLKELANARQRMHHARVEARSYFQHCKD